MVAAKPARCRKPATVIPPRPAPTTAIRVFRSIAHSPRHYAARGSRRLQSSFMPWKWLPCIERRRNPGPRSLRLDIGGPDHVAPPLGVFGDELGKLGRRAAERRGAHVGDA